MKALPWLVLVLLAAAPTRSQALQNPPAPPANTCAAATAQPIAAADRDVYCAIDIGSRNLKLAVVSMEAGRPLTLRDERSCRTRLNLGTKVYDAGAPPGQQDKPLATADIEALAKAMQEYQALCRLDGGKLVGADATEWARHATNIAEVRKAVSQRTGLDIEVLTAEQEARFGYIAATRGRAGFVVVDPGSNSFQVTAHANGETAPHGVSVPLGYEQASALYFSKAESFDAGRRAYAEAVRSRLAAAALDVPKLRGAIGSGRLARAIVALGQDAAVHLVVGGVLRDGSGRWISDEAAYSQHARTLRPSASAEYGEVTAVLRASQVRDYLASLADTRQLVQLRADPVRGLYGTKALVVPSLLDVLAQDLGVETVVLTPAEMPIGYILSKTTKY
jgi:hypothetical protein